MSSDNSSSQQTDVFNPQEFLRNAECIVSESQVQQALDTLAQAVNKDYAHTQPLLITVMNGGAYTLVELSKRLTIPVQWDYLHATRYMEKTEGRDVVWKALPSQNLQGRDIIVIDDILDEGETLHSIQQTLLKHNPKSLKLLVLTQKKHQRLAKPIQADYVGLEIPDAFVFGCGLDYQGYFRNLNALYAVNA